MARKAERPIKRMVRLIESLNISQLMRNLVVGGVIASGAALWGYAVYHVAMRTL